MGKLAVKFADVAIIEFMKLAIDRKFSFAKVDAYCVRHCVAVMFVRSDQATAASSLRAVVGEQAYVTARVDSLAEVIESIVKVSWFYCAVA